MTEYETSTLALQTATLALREWALWAAVAHVVATLIVGAAQVAVVAYGIRAMRATSAERAAEQDKRTREQDQRHDEVMKALTALIERTAPGRP